MGPDDPPKLTRGAKEPKEERPSQYEIPPFDGALHASPKGPFEVVLPIRIEHRHNFFDQVDSCEERCLKEMETRLAELGAHGGRGARIRG